MVRSILGCLKNAIEISLLLDLLQEFVDDLAQLFEREIMLAFDAQLVTALVDSADCCVGRCAGSTAEAAGPAENVDAGSTLIGTLLNFIPAPSLV